MNNSKRLCLSLTLTWAFLFPLQGRADKIWTLESLLELKTIADPQMTADGSKAAYVVRTVNMERNGYDQTIWIVAAGVSEPKRLSVSHFSDSRPRWSKDGRRLAFISSRDGNAQIYISDTLDGHPRRVTNSPTSISYFKWSPNNEEFGYLAADDLTEEEKVRIRKGDDSIVANGRIQVQPPLHHLNPR